MYKRQLQRVLAGIELAGGNLDRNAVDGRAVLADQDDLAALGERHHGRCAGMPYQVTAGHATVGELDLSAADIQEPALPGLLLRDDALMQARVAGVVVAQDERGLGVGRGLPFGVDYLDLVPVSYTHLGHQVPHLYR